MGSDDGVSAMFSLLQGWMGSYPEVTGYIIPTLFDAAELLDDANLTSRAVAMADWLLSLQQSNGAFPGSFIGRLTEARVFNTGQIIFGLIRTAQTTGHAGYLHAAERAGDWLISIQDPTGSWSRCTLNGIEHAYNIRTAWGLAELADVTGHARFREAAIANADWTVAQQCPTGWFRTNTFAGHGHSATLHTICYCIRGLLEVAERLKLRGAPSRHIATSAQRAADSLLGTWNDTRALCGSFQSDWSSPSRWRCLPGEAQLAIVWMRLGQLSGDERYVTAAVELLERVKAGQIMQPSNPDLDGAVSGALPIHAPYERYCLVSWGAKFLIDALILKERIAGEDANA